MISLAGLSSLAVGSLVSYLIAVVIPAFDALIPVLPSETIVIALGAATAGSSDPRIAVLVALAALGAFLGDTMSYLLGRRFGPAIRRRLFASPRGARRLAWAERSLGQYGARLIVVCRFIPGGRTAVTLACGLTGYPRRRFLAAAGCAGALWAGYAFFLGRLGGRAFEDQPWAGLLLGLGLSLLVTVAVEVARRLWRARASRAQAPDGNHGSDGGHGGPRGGDGDDDQSGGPDGGAAGRPRPARLAHGAGVPLAAAAERGYPAVPGLSRRGGGPRQ